LFEAVERSPVATVEDKRQVYWSIANSLARLKIPRATREHAQRLLDALPPRPTPPHPSELHQKRLDRHREDNRRTQEDIQRRLIEARSATNVRPPSEAVRRMVEEASVAK
ncbi:MAG: hypothetical protein AAF658_19025, partial [Myxococcota bacterium]